ncbi:MAG: hypothetical protein ABIJ08_05535, partial [Nanoarchaeota archaeon]
IDGAWTTDDLNNEITNLNELFILETDGNIDPLYARSKLMPLFDPGITPDDVKNWQDEFEQTYPLFVFDSPYAGSYLPKEDSFVSRLVRDSTIIAPTSFNSPQFTRSLLCQLANDIPIGQAFREARNFHYNGGSKTNSENYIGLVLQSYALYGNPEQMIDMGWSESDKEKIKKTYCKNYLENLAPNIEFLEQVGNYSKFRKHVVFEIPEYNIVDVGNFSIINATNTFQNLEYDELVLPMAVRTTHFPLNTMITNFSLDYVGDYEDLTINDLPSYEFEYVNRTCYYDNKSYDVEFDNAYKENTLDFIARIYPIEMINCTEGKVRLYKKFNYSIDYIALSPALIKDIIAPISKNINERIDVDIEIMQLTNESKNISIAIFDKNNDILYEIETTSNISNHTASFYASANEGLNRYSAEIIYENETAHYKEFYIYTTIIESKADIPTTISQNPNIDINLYSYYDENFDLNGKYYLIKDNVVIDEGIFTKSIDKGDNIQTISLTNLAKADQTYELTLETNYLNQKKTITYLLNTNNAPIINTQSKNRYYETDLIVINYSIIDYDDDLITVEINDTSRLTKQDGSFVWQTDYNDNGNYSIKITADDGYITTEKIINFEVIDVIPPANFWGEIRYENGSTAEDNLSILVYINDSYITSTYTSDGLYNISIPSDNPETSWKDGGKEGDLIEIIIDGWGVDQSLTWEQETSTEINLKIITPKEFTINLRSGWNLISFPLDLIDPLVSSVFRPIDGNYSKIFTFDEEWIELNYSSMINESMGYWIMSDEINLSIDGFTIDNITYDIKGGANLISYSDLEPISVDSFFDIDDYTVFAYNGSWITYDPKKPSQLNQLKDMEPGHGYWIYVR